MLHAGGKFGGGGYKVSGGLHGVGVSVVNALSTRLVVEVDRDGKHHRMEFAKGGKPQGKLEVVGKAPRGRTGTTDHVLARRRDLPVGGHRVPGPDDPRAAPDVRLPQQGPRDPLHATSARVTTTSRSSTSTPAASSTSCATSTPRRRRCSRRSATTRWPRTTQEVEVAFQWNTGYYEGIHSFANGIATIEGGMHEEGFKKALTNVVNKYARAKGLLKEKDDNLLGEDIREGLTAIIAVRLHDPQFEGQTKAKLGNVSMRSLVERATNEKLGDWLEEHPTEAQADRHTRRSRRHGPGWPPARRATPPGASRRSRAPACPASSPTARRATRARPSCSSSRATRPAARPSRPATRAPRRSCRSGARSSTSSGPASTRC